MSGLKISIVIPAYNEEVNIARCLDSLASQTRIANEIIVVDNNSTDNTVNVAQRYKVRIIAQSIQGIPPSTYAGLNAATGDILVRCDADCILPPSWLADIEATFLANDTLAALTGPGYFYDCNKITAWLADIFYMKAYFALTYLALAHSPLFGSNFAIRSSSWKAIKDKVHHERNDIHDDMDISIHIGPKANVQYVSNLRVGISARALRLSQLPKRYARGFRSLMIHWPSQAPWKRWKQRIHHK